MGRHPILVREKLVLSSFDFGCAALRDGSTRPNADDISCKLVGGRFSFGRFSIRWLLGPQMRGNKNAQCRK